MDSPYTYRMAADHPVLTTDAGWSWPEGRSLAIAMTITWETWPDDLGTPSSHQMSNRPPVPKTAVHQFDTWTIRDHLYAEQSGMRRLLDAVDGLGITATVFANGRTVEQHPELAREIRDRGHEFASEGWIHNYSIEMEEAEERESVERTVEAFTRVLGEPPRGYISPGHRATPHTDRIITELGYEWEASYDLWDHPHVLDVAGRHLVGMPYGLVDYQTYRYDGRSPRELAGMWEDEIAVLLAEGRAGHPAMTGYVFHPFLARGYRTKPVFDVLRAAMAESDVWVTTRGEIARWTMERFEAGGGTS